MKRKRLHDIAVCLAFNPKGEFLTFPAATHPHKHTHPRTHIHTHTQARYRLHTLLRSKKRSLLFCLHRRACRSEIFGIMMRLSGFLSPPPAPAAVSRCVVAHLTHILAWSLWIWPCMDSVGGGCVCVCACCNPVCCYGLFLCADRP